jgi:hypothetical protein
MFGYLYPFGLGPFPGGNGGGATIPTTIFNIYCYVLRMYTRPELSVRYVIFYGRPYSIQYDVRMTAYYFTIVRSGRHAFSLFAFYFLWFVACHQDRGANGRPSG